MKKYSYDKLLNTKSILVVIFITGFLIRIYMALVDPFLHDWDERFHALVAKNMMDNPLKPMLRAFAVLPVDYTEWSNNGLWLHKQPLFLWQIALSLKVFGVNFFALRLPSVLLGSLMILLVFRICKLATNNNFAALLASAFMAFSHYQLELISGKIGMDHNDVAFGFYILASIWALLEYFKMPKLKWVILIAIFAAAAILTKWLTGLLVFACWFLVIFFNYLKNKKLNYVAHFFIALLICVVIFLPWQLYILHYFPIEANYEYSINTKHIFEVIQEHKGSIFYYGRHLHLYYGIPQAIILFFALWFLLRNIYLKGILYNKAIFILISCFAIIYLFFSLIVKTKLPSYVFIVAPIGLIFIANFTTNIFEHFNFSKKVKIALIIFLLLFSLEPWLIISERSSVNISRNNAIHNTQIYKSIHKYLPDSIKVITNVNKFENIDLMFFNNNLDAYSWWFSEAELNKLKDKKIPVAVFKNHGNYNMPQYLLNYPYLRVINLELK